VLLRRLVLAVAVGTAAAFVPTLALGQAPIKFSGLPLEASGVTAVPGTSGVLVVADGSEREVFWMEIGPTGLGSRVIPVPMAANVADPEDIATDGTHFYVVGSQSRGGGRHADGLVRFRFDPVAKKTSQVERVVGFEAWLFERIPELRQLSRGRTGPLNIEGLTWDRGRERLLLGLRSPVSDGRALLIALRIGDAARPLSASNLIADGQLIALDLGGLAIRGLGYDPDVDRVLVIGGGTTDEGKGPFRLFEWDGRSSSQPMDRGPLRSEEKPEGVTRIKLAGATKTLLVFDLGGYQVLP
jgi:hypothetical protein